MTTLAGATSSLAPRRVPEAYVRAEVASYPLTSLQAFECALINLDPTLRDDPGRRDEHTAGLWRACEETLVQHGAGWSLDRIVAVRDLAWFCSDARRPEDRSVVSMHEYLRRLAAAHLQTRPGTTGVRRDADASATDAVGHYRWLTFAMPEDLLLAAVDADPPPYGVSIDPPMLVRRLLDRGVADLHQHSGACMDYPLLWTAALGALTDPSFEWRRLQGPGVPFDSGRHLGLWLLAAAIARIVLAEYLLRRDVRVDAPTSLAAFIEHVVGDASWPKYSSWPGYRRRALLVALRALELGRWTEDDEQWFPVLRDLYAELHPFGLELSASAPATLEEVWRRCDPVAARLGLARPGAGERFVVARALDYLASDAGQQDALFARIFWQALRVRCQHYRAIVQRPMTAGLQWFIRFNARIGALRGPLRRVGAEAAYWTAGRGAAIAALEARIALADGPCEIARGLLDFVLSWKNVLERRVTQERPPEVGVVLLFAKERHREQLWQRGKPPAFWMGTHAEPSTSSREQDVFSSEGRYVDFFVRRSRQARALGELLDNVPTALWLVRGLDVASDELAVPTWVMVPLYRYVLDRADRASARCFPDGPPSLRFTAHAGEDYRHLMEGLRRVYESLQYVVLETPGGRLGHATALGVEPRLWAESVGAVVVPIEERLMDLVFEWRLYSRYRVRSEFGAAAPPARTEQVANLIRELSERVFGRAYEPEHVAELHDVLHRFLVPSHQSQAADGGFDTFRRAVRRLRLGALAAPHCLNVPRRVCTLLERYLEDEVVFRRGQELVDVVIDPIEIAALVAVQQALRTGVSVNGVVVEVNPSSNLLIGDMLDLRNHPMLRLYPIEPDEHLAPVSIAVGSDDPVTFSTSLIREYTLLYEAGRAAGYADRQVLEWLEAVRRTSMDARFTLAWRPNAEKGADRLVEEFHRYLQEPCLENRGRRSTSSSD